MDPEVVPRKRRKISLSVEHLLNDIFKENKETSLSNGKESALSDTEGVAGKIKSVKLQNFMCHDNLEFNFNDKINFISGKNGSGKSAILTALVVGLGGRTADTNRGNSIKNLIQNGKTRASIEITLSNVGSSKFKHSIYGNTIKINRVISGSSSQYKIISEQGEVISTKRDVVDLINMYFNIQVNNPVIILNQDTARTFLKAAAPKDLYNIFMRGTHLEEINLRLKSLVEDKIPSLEKSIDEKKTILKEAFQDILEFTEKRKKILELEKYQDQAVDIQNQLYWAYVYKIEEKLDAQMAIEKECEKQLPVIRNKVNKRDKNEEEIKDKKKSSESLLKEIKIKSQNVDGRVIELERSLRNVKEQIKMKVNEIKRVQKTIETEKNSCNELQLEIVNHESRSAEVAAKKNKIQCEKMELEKRLRELKAVLSTTIVHQQQLSDTRNEASSTYAQKEQFYNNLKQKLAYKEDNLKSLKLEKNQLMVYSKWMPELVNSIGRAHQAGRFRKKPRGPIGSFIKLTEKKWGPAIENSIGAKTLSSFCVDNYEDYKVFKSIIDHVNMPANSKPSVIVSKFIERVHDVSQHETRDPRYKNLLRSITISDPVIANALIDSLEPETTLLVPSSREAYGLFEDVSTVPNNCKRGFTLNGDLFYPAPNYRSYAGSIDGEGTTRFLQVSQAQAVKLAEQEIETIKGELKKFKDGLEVAKLNVSKSVEELEKFNKEVYKLNKQITVCENKLDEINKEELPETYDMGLLKEDLEFRQKNVETAEDALKMLEDCKEELIVEHRQIKENYEEVQAEKNSLIEEANKVEEEISELNKEIREISGKSDHYVSLLKSEEAKLAKVKTIIMDLKNELVKAESDAKAAHPERIPQVKDIDALEKSIQKINSMIKALENIIGDVNAVPYDYDTRLKQLIEKHGTLKNLTKTANRLKDVVQILGDVSKNVRDLVTLNTKHSFSSMLQKKNFTGDLIINHEKKTLNVTIKVESAANDKTSTLTLSGGERSYSMVSFIMSLWNNMYSPFFFLDEFDVFMDEINRNIIMSMLLTYAKSNPDQQFVFLTPHANLNKDLLREVQFFSMRDPRSQEGD